MNKAAHILLVINTIAVTGILVCTAYLTSEASEVREIRERVQAAIEQARDEQRSDALEARRVAEQEAKELAEFEVEERHAAEAAAAEELRKDEAWAEKLRKSGRLGAMD